MVGLLVVTIVVVFLEAVVVVITLPPLCSPSASLSTLQPQKLKSISRETTKIIATLFFILIPQNIYYVIDYNIYLFLKSSHTIGEVIAMAEKLIIHTKSLKGEDGYKTFSIRIKNETVKNLDALAQTTNRSRNELINTLLDYALDNCEIQ